MSRLSIVSVIPGAGIVRWNGRCKVGNVGEVHVSYHTRGDIVTKLFDLASNVEEEGV